MLIEKEAIFIFFASDALQFPGMDGEHPNNRTNIISGQYYKRYIQIMVKL